MNSLVFKHVNRLVAQRPLVNTTSYMMVLNRSQRSVSYVNSFSRMFSTSQKLNDNEVIELVEGKVFEVLKSAAKCNHSKLSRTATFEDLGFDSLDGVELVLAMEENFGFDLSNQDAEKISSVMDAIQIFHSYYTKRLQPAEAPGSQ
jgi:NADH dehydrogenase (ubiquinone) 1 alpha/beta subcomplex 1